MIFKGTQREKKYSRSPRLSRFGRSRRARLRPPRPHQPDERQVQGHGPERHQRQQGLSYSGPRVAEVEAGSCWSVEKFGHTAPACHRATFERPMPIMQFLDWITALLQKLESKDILTLTLSSSSLVIAGLAFVYTVFSKRRELAISVRNDLHDCILKLSENKVQFESLRRELGDDFRKVQHSRERVALTEQRQLFLARAVYLIERYRRRVDTTSQDFLLIAAALADQGEFSGSLRFYRRSVRYAFDKRMKATALRVFGRALIPSGSAKAGRRKMLQSVALFEKLERVGYDRGTDDL